VAARVNLAGVSGESFVYLRESANCYIFGSPQAFPLAMRKAAYDRVYLEKLELARNPRLSRQQARSLFHSLLSGYSWRRS
jgi:hypothetical protein